MYTGCLLQTCHGSLLAPRKSFDIMALHKSDYYYIIIIVQFLSVYLFDCEFRHCFIVVYRQVWQSLEDMNKDEAMSQFVHCLSVSCPQFTKHIEALQQHRNELLSKEWVFPLLLSLSRSCESVCVCVSCVMQVILSVTFLSQVEHGRPGASVSSSIYSGVMQRVFG